MIQLFQVEKHKIIQSSYFRTALYAAIIANKAKIAQKATSPKPLIRPFVANQAANSIRMKNPAIKSQVFLETFIHQLDNFLTRFRGGLRKILGGGHMEK